MARTIIVGGGGFGRELFSWAQDCSEAGSLPTLGGIIDDDPHVLEGFQTPVGWLSRIQDFAPSAEDHLVLAIGGCEARQRVAELLRGRGGRFVGLVHPTVVISRSASVADGIVACPFAMISAYARVAEFVILNAYSSVGHDVTVGEYSTLSSHVDLTAGVRLGVGVTIGSGARVLPGIAVGDHAVIGAGAIVYRTVPAGDTAYAQPAKLMRRGRS
jgi:sugar O-acyltransferase (sialic acid O-acetyltransferase NeuD family)